LNIVLATALIWLTHVTAHPAIDTAAVYATIHNNGPLADALDQVDTPLGIANLQMEIRVPLIAVSADGTMKLERGGYYISIDHLKHPLRSGESFPLKLHFRRAGWVWTTCTVVP
jgi:periplasmic copper chaperone A